MHIHQANDFESERQALGVIANGFENCRRKADRGKHAGRVAGVHASFFDVLHDSADDDSMAVGERVNVNFGGFFEELIDQHRTRGAH